MEYKQKVEICNFIVKKYNALRVSCHSEQNYVEFSADFPRQGSVTARIYDGQFSPEINAQELVEREIEKRIAERKSGISKDTYDISREGKKKRKAEAGLWVLKNADGGEPCRVCGNCGYEPPFITAEGMKSPMPQGRSPRKPPRASSIPRALMKRCLANIFSPPICPMRILSSAPAANIAFPIS